MNAEPTNLGNVFLIGYRCTGKSSVGSLLSAKLGWPFIDTDSLLVSGSGRSIKEIVETDGWETFRKMEHALVEQVCAQDQRVVATGGGVVLDAANVELMKKSGRLVWLRAKPETIKNRMMQDLDTDAFRPALTSKDSIAEIEETLLERESYYRRAMDFHVHTDSLGLDAIVNSIIENLFLQFSKCNLQP
ncbi:MAG: shikimate kinase [Desulfobacterales bacterium]|nr:MAG: shikimate kinase [Desulfobacterales bacterium]